MINPLFSGKGQDIVLFLMEQNDKEKTYDLIEHKESRSLNANSYFHVLADKLRHLPNIQCSMACMKNHLITDYGQIWYMDDEQTEPMFYKTNAPEEYIKELESLHMKCIRVSEENGKPVYYYRMYRGSHTYNSQEMSLLIAGTVQECEQQGIQTMTPAEISHLVGLWKPKEKEN